MGKRPQIVWWGFEHRKRWLKIHLRGIPYPNDGPNKGAIYSACYRAGPLELRRWA